MCFTSYNSAELFLNGRSMGIRRKGEFAASNIDFSVEDGRCLCDVPTIKMRDCISDFRLIWDEVPYEPGELKVVAFDDAGKPVMEQIIETTSGPAAIELTADRSALKADGDDLSFVTVRIVDSEGRSVPTADNLIEFELAGQGELIAVDNGDATSLESFQGNRRKAFSGMCLAIVRSVLDERGKVTLIATSPDLKSAEIVIKTS
jgi:beta-galactosidase